MQMLASLITYVVVILICYGVAYLFNADVINIIAFVALALGVDALARVD
jgi:hypothetical protein